MGIVCQDATELEIFLLNGYAEFQQFRVLEQKCHARVDTTKERPGYQKETLFLHLVRVRGSRNPVRAPFFGTLARSRGSRNPSSVVLLAHKKCVMWSTSLLLPGSGGYLLEFLHHRCECAHRYAMQRLHSDLEYRHGAQATIPACVCGGVAESD